MNLIHLYFTIHYLIHALVYHLISIECYCNVDLKLKVKSSDSMPSFIQQLFVMLFCTTSCILYSTHHHSYWSKKPFIQHITLIYWCFHFLFNCLIIHHSVSCHVWLFQKLYVACNIQYSLSSFTSCNDSF